MKPGLASKDGKQRVGKPWSQPLGKVEPFDIRVLRTSNFINSGRTLTIEFSHQLAPDITPETAGKFLSIEPPVPNLRFEGWSNEFIAKGDFELEREYRLIVGEDFISGDAVAFAGERSRRLPFRSRETPALSPGNHRQPDPGRQPQVRSAVGQSNRPEGCRRLVDPADAAAAIVAFGKYERENADYDNHEFYQPLPVYSFRSERIAERRIETAAGPLDARQLTAVDWNDVLGGRKTGVVFLTVEGEPRAEVGGKRPGAQALIQLTDLGVMWKKIAEGLQVTVFSMETGKPLENTIVTLLDKEFKTTREAVTDARRHRHADMGG